MDDGVEKKYFYSIQGEQTTSIKIKRSVFLCSLKHARSLDEAKQFITRVSKENKTATHNCWAYILGDAGDIFHSSDAGEPSGTAGKPMLNALQKYQMTWVAAIVTRHFGGVKLGVRGLMDAYGESVEETIQLKPLKKLIQTIRLEIEVAYEFNDTLLNLIKKHLVCMNDTVYTEKIVHRLEIAREKKSIVIKMLKEYQAMGKLNLRVCKGK